MNHKTKSLPLVVSRFLEAANLWDENLAAACFTTNGTVRDEDREFEGRKEIQGWVAETSRRYRPSFVPLKTFASDDAVRGQIAVSGQFPGSPVTLDYEFRVENGKISILTIV
jgi:hypothetical protein